MRNTGARCRAAQEAGGPIESGRVNGVVGRRDIATMDRATTARLATGAAIRTIGTE